MAHTSEKQATTSTTDSTTSKCRKAQHIKPLSNIHQQKADLVDGTPENLTNRGILYSTRDLLREVQKLSDAIDRNACRCPQNPPYMEKVCEEKTGRS
ncbi:hypothetical protein LTR10_010550 [Elasticomyces elasticus]|nr:hypothetical protein LTR10_010550 [Elasticomyces elasticus]KAK4972451.1 hypothetical protein LTR42_006960 [Elasticomyces elasticus]